MSKGEKREKEERKKVMFYICLDYVIWLWVHKKRKEKKVFMNRRIGYSYNI